MWVLSCYMDQKYENILTRDYNAEVLEASVQEVYESYLLENMVKKLTWFKNPVKPTCFDLIITNKPGMFHNPKIFERFS